MSGGPKLEKLGVSLIITNRRRSSVGISISEGFSISSAEVCPARKQRAGVLVFGGTPIDETFSEAVVQ
jgi:hypothetical protein